MKQSPKAKRSHKLLVPTICTFLIIPQLVVAQSTFSKTPQEAYEEMLEQRRREAQGISVAAQPVSSTSQQAPSSITVTTTFTKTPQEAYEEMLAQREREAQNNISAPVETTVMAPPVVIAPAPIAVTPPAIYIPNPSFTKTPQEAYEEMLAQRAKEEQGKKVTEIESKPAEKPVTVSVPTQTPSFTKTPQEAYEEMLAQRAKEEQGKIATQTESKPAEKSVTVSVPTQTPSFTKTPQEAYEEMLAQRAKEDKTSSATPDYLEQAMLAEKKIEAENAVKRSVASEKVAEEKPTQAEKKQEVVSVKFSHANSFMEDERSLKKSEKEKLLSKDGELHRFRIWRILNFLESVEKEEQIKRITYLGGRKVLAGEHFYSINDKGQEVILNNLPQYKSSAEANYYVHSYEVEPFGKISVLQAGEGPTLLRAYIIKEEAKEVCYIIQASTQKCNLAKTAYLAVSADKAIKDEENLKFTRVAVNELSDTLPMFTKLSWRFSRPGFFRSLNLVKDEIDSKSGRPAKIFTYEFSVCANKVKFVSPARKDYYNDPFFYTSYGGKSAETPEGVNCKQFSMEDLNNLDFESIDSKDNSNFKRIMSEMLK